MLMLNRSLCASHSLQTSRPTRQPAMAHKLDLGFHHYNIRQTSPEAFAARPLVHRSRSLITTQVGSTVVRCLPTDSTSGFVDVPDTNPTDPNSPAAVSEEVLLAYEGQGSGVSGATRPPQQEMGPSSGNRSRSSKGGNTERDMLNAHWYPAMPKGPEAHNAAHCEPIPGDWPDPAPLMKPDDAVSPDEPLDAIHAMGASHTPGSGPVGDASAGAARDDSSLQAHGVSQQGESSGSVSKPADDPEGIKGVVRQETLHESPEGTETA